MPKEFIGGVGMKYRAIAALALALAACHAGGQQPAAGRKPDGRHIFNNASKGNCIACHRVTGEKYVGPGLAGTGGLHSRAWLEKWLADPQKVWDENDAETAALKKRLGAESRKFTGMKMISPLQEAERAALADYLMTL
ncbi:MAG: cytochrome c [Candidatus Nitrosotenuis sp.]|nr:MAG: cytochrome c [Candidatus Nitrosotenuis sp.]